MKITRKTASRRLKRKCFECNAGFIKGNVYYLHRWVSGDENSVYSYEHLVCAKCSYKERQRKRRFEKFQKKCEHPDEFRETQYCSVAGETYMIPDYDYCRLCSQKI